MRKFWPYYLSRALISIGLSVLVFGITWAGAAMAAVMFGLFLLYLHSGWFAVERGQPLTPLRRDERGRNAQRSALIAAILCAAALYSLSVALPRGATAAGGIAALAIPLGVLVYFGVQFFLLARS